MKLLIVDDEEKIREVIKEYALSSGYEVQEASQGNEAMDLLDFRYYDAKNGWIYFSRAM